MSNENEREHEQREFLSADVPVVLLVGHLRRAGSGRHRRGPDYERDLCAADVCER